MLAGNCGFSIAPTRPEDRPFFAGLFAKVEGMSPIALSGVRWEFETFAEFLASRAGKLGVNTHRRASRSSREPGVMPSKEITR